jgi:FkbM family methyltransferase
MRLLKRIFFGRYAKISYSQCGEDLAICSIFEALGIQKPSYIDIGAHDPIYLSNTYLLYLKGSKGVCIEPNPELYSNIKRKRKRDTCLNMGVGISSTTEAHFYCMTSSTLGTFSRKDAERMASYGNEKIEKVITIPLISFGEVVTKQLSACPNFVSLDVEGLDLAILKSIDLIKYRPQVFCVETLTYTEDKTEKKILETIEFMLDNGYFIYGDTFVNTIFVDKAAWAARR